jgi:NADH-quinone oxidoreductase subunit J
VIVQDVTFWILAVPMVFAALRVVTTKNIVHAALYLVVVLAGAAAQYILLAAEFVAWVQVLVYIGAVVIIFLFGIMLTRAPMEDNDDLNNDQKWIAAIVGLLLTGGLTAMLISTYKGTKIHIDHPTRAADLAGPIFRTYLVPFEVVSMLLLAALVGAVVLARRD